MLEFEMMIDYGTMPQELYQKTQKTTALKSLQSLVMPFGTSFYLENRLERLPK